MKLSHTIFVVLLLVNSLSGQENAIGIRNGSEINLTDYPAQIGRPFVKGEIQDYPQIVMDGEPLVTQADIKQRYSDGSVKHAILSFYIPALEAHESKTISFKNQSTGNNNSFLSGSEMLAENFDFGADIVMKNITEISVSAREMIENDKFIYWNKGKISTTVIVADHTADRSYDIGFDSYRSIRPIFHVTFWPAINKYEVRYIGENTNSEAYQDQEYKLDLYMNNKNRVLKYTKADFVHTAGSRWTKKYWNSDPATNKVSINHNLAYLSRTKFTPNFDTSKVIPESEIASKYENWQTRDKDIYDAGWWSKAINAPGGRPDFGIYPSWTVWWLYTGDYRMEEIALKQGELAAAWKVHLREADTTKYLDRAHTVKGIGKVVSVSTRPTLWSDHLTSNENKPEDKIDIVGETINNGWYTPDNEHFIDPSTIQYVLTGDYWYLEESYFFAAFAVASYTPGYNRGPTGAEGGIRYGAGRAHGRHFRTRIHTAFVAPDDDPEKAYFEQLVQDAIEIWEGVYNITGTEYEGSELWNWGNTQGAEKQFGDLGLPDINFWVQGVDGYANKPYLKANYASKALAPWGKNIVLYSLGRAEELGYKTSALKAWLGKWFIGQFTNTNYDPYLISAYIQPTVKYGGTEWFTSWKDIKNAYTEEYQASAQSTFENTALDTEHGYTNIALTAASYIADLPDGNIVWSFMEEHALNNDVLNKNPKWALIPRVEINISTIDKDIDIVNSEIIIYPNPFNEQIIVEFESITDSNTNFEIYSIEGRKVLHVERNSFMQLGTFQKILDLSYLKPGVYILKFSMGDTGVSKKIVKQ